LNRWAELAKLCASWAGPADAGRPQPEPDPRVCAECPKQYTCPRAVREPRDLVESR
jgi:hypothetical protein